MKKTITTEDIAWDSAPDDPKVSKADMEAMKKSTMGSIGGTVVNVKTSPPNLPAIEKSTMAVENGVYTLGSINEQMTYAKFLIDNGLVSDTFKKPSQLIVAIQFCKDLGLSNSALSNFYVIGGKPAVFGDTLIGLVMGSGLVEDKKITWFDEEGAVINLPKKGTKFFGCQVEYKRKGFSNYVQGIYTLDDKEIAKPTNPVWIKFWKDMIWRRADIRAVKALFPDTLRGIEVVEYLEDAELKLDGKEKAKQATNVFSSEGEE